MIIIEYTHEEIETEPGPNLFWKGTPEDFYRLVIDLHKLGTKNDLEIILSNFNYIYTKNNAQVFLKSSEEGSTLFKIENNSYLIDLDKILWREILHFFLSISFCPSHNYVEFDNLDLLECGNFIISSGK